MKNKKIIFNLKYLNEIFSLLDLFLLLLKQKK